MEKNEKVILTWVEKKQAENEPLKLTVGEFIKKINVGEILIPLEQRNVVTPVVILDGMVETILNGDWLPNMIICKILGKDGEKDTSLLTDGRQRLAAILAFFDKWQAAINDDNDNGTHNVSDYDFDRFQTFLSREVAITVISCETTKDAARLFIVYNLGIKLSGIQRGRAEFSQDVLVRTKLYADYFTKNTPAKLGKVTNDTAALMLAACLTDKQKASTSSAGATKILKAAAAIDVPDLPTDAVDAYLAAITNPDDPGYKALMLSPVRLCPAIMAIIDSKATPVQVTSLFAAYNSSARDTLRIQGKDVGKKATDVKPVVVGDVWGNTSNASGATWLRYQVLLKQLKNIIANDAKVAKNAGKPSPAAENDPEKALLDMVNKAMGMEK